jgi:hypothetical protein
LAGPETTDGKNPELYSWERPAYCTKQLFGGGRIGADHRVRKTPKKLSDRQVRQFVSERVCNLGGSDEIDN